MTAVVLAGGGSRRMGRDKTALYFRGETLLQRACRRFGEVFDPVWVSVRTPKEAVPAEQIADEFPGCGPMAGLHAALKRRPEGGVFLLAADLPLAEPELALRLIGLGQGHQACVPEREPLFGWYGPEALEPAEQLLRAGEYRMTELLRRLDTRFVPLAELGRPDAEHTLLNVNDPEAYRLLQSL